MKRLVLFFGLIALFGGCNALGVGKRCKTCVTEVYNPANGSIAGQTEKEVCENQDGLDKYVKDNTSVTGGIGRRTYCK